MDVSLNLSGIGIGVGVFFFFFLFSPTVKVFFRPLRSYCTAGVCACFLWRKEGGEGAARVTDDHACRSQ